MLYLTLGPLNFESTCTKYRMASDFRGYNRLWFSLIKQGFNIACMHACCYSVKDYTHEIYPLYSRVQSSKPANVQVFPTWDC